MDVRYEAFIAELRQKLQHAVENQNFAMISFYAKLIEDTKRDYRLVEETKDLIARLPNRR